MMRDPFWKAQEVPADQRLEKIFTHLFPLQHGHGGFRVLICTPTDRPKFVIEATAGGPCDKCGASLWMSPSSHRSHFDARVCLVCLEKAATELKLW